MRNMIITNKEYEELLEAKKRLNLVFKASPRAKKRGFFDRAFGILKSGFGERSSITYVAKLREAWRE